MTLKCTRLSNRERNVLFNYDSRYKLATNLPREIPCRPNVLTLNCGPPEGACVERRAACGASYNACASGATPCKFETRQPARPAGKATADRQFQRRVSPRAIERRW